jgi:SAM-dependent methyltransferase
MLAGAVRGAAEGARSDPGLLWAVDAERVRRAVPDAAIGACWQGLDEFLDVLAPRLGPQIRALEIGCGGGRVADAVAPLVRELVVSDVAPLLLDEARGNLAHHDNVVFRLSPGYALAAFPDDAFDVVFAHDVFVNLDPDPVLALLDAAARTVKPGGVVVASFYTIDRPEWRRASLEKLRRAVAQGRFAASSARPYAAAQVDAWFRTVGLEPAWSGYPDPHGHGDRRHYVVAGGLPVSPPRA